MSKYIKGDAVANATSYELYEKVGSNYSLLDKKNEINFNLDEISFDSGEHILVVKAKAVGYEDSEYSNEVTIGGGGTLNEYIGYDELAQYVKFGNVQTDAVNDTSDVITVSKNGATGDLELAQTNADGKYTVCFLNLPLTVGSEVTLTATNYAGEMAPNAMIGIDSNISTFPVANTWKNQAGTTYIAASHIYMQPSSTTNKNSSYLERGTNQFVGCSPAIGCWSVTASTSDYTAFSEFTLKVLDVGFAIYKNGSLIATVNSSKSNTYIDNTTLPAYFMISCAATAGYKISIKSVKVA